MCCEGLFLLIVTNTLFFNAGIINPLKLLRLQLEEGRVLEAERRKDIYADRLAVAEGAIPLTHGEGEADDAHDHDVLYRVALFALTVVY